MSTFEIEGGVPLRGTIRVSGNKNAILPMIAACILTDQEVILDNVPDIIDVRHMLDVIVEIGGKVERSGERVSIHVAQVRTSEIGQALCNKVRTSILCVAGLLHRTGSARLYPPGGDVIGRRRLDTHFYGLMKLGAKVSINGVYDFTMPGPLTGAELFFDEPSVTGTEHIEDLHGKTRTRDRLVHAAGDCPVEYAGSRLPAFHDQRCARELAQAVKRSKQVGRSTGDVYLLLGADHDIAFSQDMQVLDRVMSKVEFRMRNYGEDEATARKMVAMVTAEQQPVDFFPATE